MDFEQRKNAFVALGQEIEQAINEANVAETLNIRQKQLREISVSLHKSNGWFTEQNVRTALGNIAAMLQEEEMHVWLSQYTFTIKEPKTVGVVMAGNIPAVGFHDFLCVLLAGHRIKVKLSTNDSVLIPALAAMLTAIEPSFADFIHFTSERIGQVDAIIATGSNNSSRYFEYYFSKYPHIIRKNRTSVAIIASSESESNLKKLYQDIFLYFGMGCRNVTKVFVPEDFDFIHFLQLAEEWTEIAQNNKYLNNYEYNKAIYLVNGIAHYDNGFLLMKEDQGIHPPLSVIYYEKYKKIGDVKEKLDLLKNDIQCIVTNKTSIFPDAIEFGISQKPAVNEYADGIDTMKFLLNI